MSCESLLGLLDDRQLDTLALGKGYPRLCALANGEDIAKTGGKLVALRVLNVDGLKAALMLFPVLDDSNTPSVPSSGHHDDIPNIELDEVNNLVVLQVQLDGVIGLDEWVWVADGSPVEGVQVRDSLLSKLH